MRDPDLRRRMGRAWRERVEQHFGAERMVQATEALYEELLREKMGPGGGTLKIISETVKSGKPEPEFIFEDGMFRLVLFR